MFVYSVSFTDQRWSTTSFMCLVLPRYCFIDNDYRYS